MGIQIISGSVLMILAFMLISNADKWTPAFAGLSPMFRTIINTLQGVTGN